MVSPPLLLFRTKSVNHLDLYTGRVEITGLVFPLPFREGYGEGRSQQENSDGKLNRGA